MFILLSMSCDSIFTFLLAYSLHVSKINITSFKIWSLKASVIIHIATDLKSLDHGQTVQPFS